MYIRIRKYARDNITLYMCMCGQRYGNISQFLVLNVCIPVYNSVF